MDLSTAGPIVLQTLTNACNQCPDVMKPAEKQLQDWEHEPGFYSILTVCLFIHSIRMFICLFNLLASKCRNNYT